MFSKKLLSGIFFCIFIFYFFTTVFGQSCGNGSCETGENSCTCFDDCGKCEGAAPGKACSELFCTESNQCSVRPVLNCCGNNSCESGEDYNVCPADCIPKSIEIKVLSPLESTFVHGEEILLKLEITADKRPVSSPKVSANSFLGKTSFFNDGKHEDELAGDNVFANKIVVPIDLQQGKEILELNAEFLGVSANKKLEWNIDPALSVQTSAKSEVVLGENIEIRGNILKKNNPIVTGFEVHLFVNSEEVFFDSGKTDENGFFNTLYHTSLLDRTGNWGLVISAVDDFNNTGKFESTVNVKKPEKIEPLNIELINELKEKYAHGDEINFFVRLVNDRQELVKNAEVFLVLPGGKKEPLVEIEAGKYARSISVSRDFMAGNNSFEIHAFLTQNELPLKAQKQVITHIISSELAIEILEPSNLTYRAGEKMQLTIKVTDFEGEPVNDAQVMALVNNQEVLLELTKIGIYSGAYEIKPFDEGKLKIDFLATDGFKNEGLKTREVTVGGKGFFYDLDQNVVLFGVLTIILLVFGTIGLVFFRSKKSEKKLEHKIFVLNEYEKNVQEKYFHEHSISKQEYKELMENYEKELKDAREQLKELKKKKD